MENGKKRPVGIWVLIVLNVIGMLAFPFLPQPVGAGGDPVVGLIGSACGAVVAYGLYSLKPWGRYVGIINYCLGILFALGSAKILAAIVPFCIVLYLVGNAEVRAAFARSKPAESEAGHTQTEATLAD